MFKALFQSIVTTVYKLLAMNLTLDISELSSSVLVSCNSFINVDDNS